MFNKKEPSCLAVKCHWKPCLGLHELLVTSTFSSLKETLPNSFCPPHILSASSPGSTGLSGAQSRTVILIINFKLKATPGKSSPCLHTPRCKHVQIYKLGSCAGVHTLTEILLQTYKNHTHSRMSWCENPGWVRASPKQSADSDGLHLFFILQQTKVEDLDG